MSDEQPGLFSDVDDFDSLDRQIAVERYVRAHYGTLEKMNRSMEREFAGQTRMNADAMMAHLLDYAQQHSDDDCEAE